MQPVAKWLITIGVVLIIIGVVWQLLGRFIPFGRLPGDIVINRENVKVFFPITTMIIISILLSLLFSLTRFFR